MSKTIVCREHSGTFEIPSQRGRPPVRCTAKNPCTNNSDHARKSLADMDLPELKAYARSIGMRLPKLTNRAQLRNAIRRYQAPLGGEVTEPAPVDEPVAVAEVPPVATPNVAKALAAKALLEPLGWHCTARTVQTAEAPDSVEMTATRGEELLSIVWVSGRLLYQNYGLWSTAKPSKNAQPPHKLPFDPDELPDRELIRAIMGMKVTWWNRIASSEETAIASPNKISISHAYDYAGDEMPGDRVITFVDHSGNGFKSFRAGALLKIG